MIAELVQEDRARHSRSVGTSQGGFRSPTVVYWAGVGDSETLDGTYQSKDDDPRYALLVNTYRGPSFVTQTWCDHGFLDLVWKASFGSSLEQGWMTLAASNPSELTVKEVRKIIENIHSVIEGGRIEEVKTALTSAEFNNFSKDAIVAVFRSLYSSRADIDNWNELVTGAVSSLEKRGADATSVAKLA